MNPPRPYLSFLLVLWLAGCNAPRDNPYDPDADNYVGPGASSISGRVTTYAGEELAGAEIMANPLSPGAVRGSYSNSAGYYTITEVLPGSLLPKRLRFGYHGNLGAGEGLPYR